ncbi:MAG: polyprenyl synthetase family protein [Clostridia bacterium]|nr:polyprenyl synthetase family protein [Clostridia bacterium]
MYSFEDYRQMLNDYLPSVIAEGGRIPANGGIPSLLAEGMNYSLLAGGKRLRGVLLLAAYGESGQDVTRALPFAAALEMIHAYSLIHDDLPAMDNDDLRRGKPTNHKVYGEGMAVLNGDGLLNAAYELMLKAALNWPDPKAALLAIETIARRAGVTGMVAGQCVDVSMEGSEPTFELVSYIHSHKTADLITAPLEAGLMLWGGDHLLEAGRDYGFHLGITFQMVDDCLDVEGDEKLLGKKTGMDAARGKLTWPALVGVEKTHFQAQSHYEKAIVAAGHFQVIGNFLKTLAQTMQERVQ